MMDPIEAEPNKVPKVPLLTDKFDFKSGVRGASDMIEMPNKKKIRLR